MNDEVRAYVPPLEAYSYPQSNGDYEILLAGDPRKLQQKELDI